MRVNTETSYKKDLRREKDIFNRGRDAKLWINEINNIKEKYKNDKTFLGRIVYKLICYREKQFFLQRLPQLANDFVECRKRAKRRGGEDVYEQFFLNEIGQISTPLSLLEQAQSGR